jgi:hypothetical protein
MSGKLRTKFRREIIRIFPDCKYSGELVLLEEC